MLPCLAYCLGITTFDIKLLTKDPFGDTSHSQTIALPLVSHLFLACVKLLAPPTLMETPHVHLPLAALHVGTDLTALCSVLCGVVEYLPSVHETHCHNELRHHLESDVLTPRVWEAK